MPFEQGVEKKVMEKMAMIRTNLAKPTTTVGPSFFPNARRAIGDLMGFGNPPDLRLRGKALQGRIATGLSLRLPGGAEFVKTRPLSAKLLDNLGWMIR